MVHGPAAGASLRPLHTPEPPALPQEPVLTTADGQKIAQSEAIARYGAPPAAAAAHVVGFAAPCALLCS